MYVFAWIVVNLSQGLSDRLSLITLETIYEYNPPKCFLVETKTDLYQHLPAPSSDQLQDLAKRLKHQSRGYTFSEVQYILMMME
jgi:hypothetical protein